jgi:hypothetical protein
VQYDGRSAPNPGLSFEGMPGRVSSGRRIRSVPAACPTRHYPPRAVLAPRLSEVKSAVARGRPEPPPRGRRACKSAALRPARPLRKCGAWRSGAAGMSAEGFLPSVWIVPPLRPMLGANAPFTKARGAQSHTVRCALNAAFRALRSGVRRVESQRWRRSRGCGKDRAGDPESCASANSTTFARWASWPQVIEGASVPDRRSRVVPWDPVAVVPCRAPLSCPHTASSFPWRELRDDRRGAALSGQVRVAACGDVHLHGVSAHLPAGHTSVTGIADDRSKSTRSKLSTRRRKPLDRLRLFAVTAPTKKLEVTGGGSPTEGDGDDMVKL